MHGNEWAETYIRINAETAEMYQGPWQTSMMKIFCKKLPIIFAKKLHHRCLARS